MEGTQRGGLLAVDGSGQRIDGWIGAMRPDDVTVATPASLEPGSPAAKRARAFGAPAPTLALPGLGALRPLDDRDIDAATKACQDPEAVRWTTIPPGYQRVDAEHFIRNHARAAWLQGQAGLFAIVDETDAYCGSIDLRISGDDHGRDRVPGGSVGTRPRPRRSGQPYDRGLGLRRVGSDPDRLARACRQREGVPTSRREGRIHVRGGTAPRLPPTRRAAGCLGRIAAENTDLEVSE